MDFDDFNDDIQAGGAAGMQDEDGAGEQMEPLEQQKPKPKRVIKKRAKLTLEQLQAPNGLPEVFEKFPKWFQEGYKGKGHEVRDLRRLLELYQRWHPRLFNYCDYNQFESTLEKMSGTNALKVKLQDMRAKLSDFVDPRPPEQEQGHADGDIQRQQQADQQQQHEAGTSQPPPPQQQQAGGFDDIDDDELLELQQAPMDVQLMDELMDEWEPPAAAQQPAVPPAPAASSQPAEQQRSSGSGAMPSPGLGAQDAPRTAPKRTMRDWSDDDDDDDLLELPSKQPKRQPAQQRVAQPGSNSAGSSGAPPAPAHGIEDDDDDDVDLAASSPAAAAPQPVRGRLRQRQLLAESDGEDEGTAAAAIAAELEDVEDSSPPVQLQKTIVETEAAVGVELVAEPMDEGADEGAAGDEKQPALKLQVGTEYEGSARRTFLIDDDDDDA